MIDYSSKMVVTLVDSMGTDESIVKAARVSTDTVDKDTNVDRFIDFLMRNRHMSPFEHCVVTFAVEAPIFVWREMMRHRTMSFNELSARYSKLEPKFYIPDFQHRGVVQAGKPGEYTFASGTARQERLAIRYHMSAYASAWNCYADMLEEGIAREVARSVLPVGIYSKGFVTVKLRNLLQFFSLRTTDADATFPSYPQAEIEDVARQMEALTASLFPATVRAFQANGRVGL